MFQRFTDAAREVVVRAQFEARDLQHERIGGEHLLLGAAAEDGPAGRALRSLGLEPAPLRQAVREVHRPRMDPDALASIGIDLDEVRRRVEAAFGPGALDGGAGRHCRAMPFTPEAKKALELALRESLSRGDNFIGSEHVLLGLLRAEEDAPIAALRRRGASPERVRDALLAELGG